MDYYRVLGISRNASNDEIKAAYRQLAKQWHPDKHNTQCDSAKLKVENKFRLVVEAYEVLGDKQKRLLYNRQKGESVRGGWRGSEYSARSGGGFHYRPGPRSSNSSSGGGTSWGEAKAGNNYYYNRESSAGAQDSGFRNSQFNAQSGASGTGFGTRERFWRAPLRALNRHDLIFHVALAGVVLTGVIFGGNAGDYIWHKLNSGKSFEEVMASRKKENGD